ncbi:hypothetical protein ACQY0O_003597 [Thecaphora frezii]
MSADAPPSDRYRAHLKNDTWQPSATDQDADEHHPHPSQPLAPASSPAKEEAPSSASHLSASAPADHDHDVDNKRSSLVQPDSVRRPKGHAAFDVVDPLLDRPADSHRSRCSSAPGKESHQSASASFPQAPSEAAVRKDADKSTNGSLEGARRKQIPKLESEGEDGAKRPTRSRLKRILAAARLDKPPPQVAWIPGTLTWPKLKPVIRSAIIAWICMVLMLIRPVENTLGSASFLVLISAFIQTADLPFLAVMERELFSLLMACCAWAYTLIPISIAHAVRSVKLTPAQTNAAAVYEAAYLESRPAVVCAFFLAFGSAVFLYVKVRFGPGPFLFGTIFSCILLNISLTYAPLYPYPVYNFGQAIAVPLAVKFAVTVVVYSLFFPKSVNSQFVERLVAVLRPLQKAADGQVELFERSPLDSEFDFELVRTLLNQAEGGLMPLSMSSRLLTREISFGLASGEDLKGLETLARALVTPADGWSFYFSSIRADLETAHFPKTPLPSRMATPAVTPTATPRGSGDLPRKRSSQLAAAALVDNEDAHAHSSAVAVHMRHLDEKPSVAPGDERLSSRFLRMHMGLHGSSRSSSPRRWFHHDHHDRSHHPHHYSHPSHHSHHSHHHGVFHNLTHRQSSVPVAMWESIRFGNIETHLHTAASNPTTELFAHLIHESSKDLLRTNAECIAYLISRLEALNRRRFAMFRERFTCSHTSLMLAGEKRAQETARMVQRLEAALEDFKTEKRFRVLDPFRNALTIDSQLDELAEDLDLRMGPGEISRIHHRYLYQAWLHQFHTASFSRKLLALLRGYERIERERAAARVWGPSWFRLFHLDAWRDLGQASGDHELEEEDPETIPGMDSEHRSGAAETERTGQTTLNLGQTRPRDPDALDPDGAFQVLGQKLYFLVARFFQGHLLFAVKAAILIALVSLPAYMRSSASWCYNNRAIWAIFMAQLTLARFRGETAFALLSRLAATLVGACFGLAIWYISTGLGHGNAYGLGATTAFAFPLLMLFRLYYPGPPITSIITSVTVMLIVGYSWKDVTNPSPGSPGFGWTVTWKRFVTVAIGVTAAYLFSYLPPSNSLRKHQRLSHATTIAELGKSYCRVVSIAASPHHGAETDGEAERVNKRLIALRAKLRRLDMAAVNVSYEYSLRGRWPKARYTELFKVQMELLKLLSHTLTVISQLGPAYSLALLRRTRFLDPLFLGDVISVISMCSTALKTASPLPQITPCPLLDRFMLFEHGFDVRYPDHGAGGDDDEGSELLATLPKKISLATLKDEEYLAFAVGVVTLFGLVVRIDRLCVAVKELVGESFEVPADIHRTMVIRSPEWSKRL